MKRREEVPVNDDLEVKQKEKKQPYFATKRGGIISMMLMVCLVIVFAGYNFASAGGGTITYEANDEMFGICCLEEPALFISYQDIKELEEITTLSIRTTIESIEWENGWCGRYENAEWGEFTMYAYSDVGKYIVLKYDDSVLVFNGKSVQETDRIYEELEKRL